MTLGRQLRFQGEITRIGLGGLFGVIRDRASVYRSVLSGRETAPVTEFDPFSPEAMRDPFPLYKTLYTGPKVWYSRKRGIWLIPGYDEVWQAVRDDDVLSSAQGQARFRIRLATMNASDAPEHTRLRRSVSRAFSPRAMQAWEDDINPTADELVDAVIARGRTDLVADLAKPLPNRVIAMRLGVPREDHPMFLGWADTINEGAFVPLTLRGVARTARVGPATLAMYRHLDPIIRHRREHPGDDLISMLADTSGKDVLTDREVFWSASMLMGAGSETATNLISGLFLTFAKQPDVYARLRENPDLVGQAIEEQLRFSSPVQGFYRTALRDYPIGDHVIPAGGRVLIMYGAGNRDPRHYENPDVYDLDRNPTDHLAFGGGAHYCLGTHLTRMEVGRAVRRMLPRVKAIELDGEYSYMVNANMRGLEKLPLKLVPA